MFSAGRRIINCKRLHIRWKIGLPPARRHNSAATMRNTYADSCALASSYRVGLVPCGRFRARAFWHICVRRLSGWRKTNATAQRRNLLLDKIGSIIKPVNINKLCKCANTCTALTQQAGSAASGLPRLYPRAGNLPPHGAGCPLCRLCGAIGQTTQI